MTSPTPSEPRTRPKLYHADAAALAPSTAWAIVIAAIAVIWGIQGALAAAGFANIAGSVIGNVIVIACLGALAKRTAAGAVTLGLRRVQPRMIAAAVLIGIAAWYINLQLVLLVHPPGSTQGLQRVVEETPLWSTLLALALLPAVAEELVFRGVLARALAVRAPMPIAIGASAAAFAVYHLMPAQMVSTFTLGLALAFLTLRGGSVVPAMLAHFLNNAIAIVISREELPAFDDWLMGHGAIVLVLAIASVGSGVALAAKGGA